MSPKLLRFVNFGLLATVAVLLLVFGGRLRAADPFMLAAPVHINVGGDALTDGLGITWLPDTVFDSASGYGHVDFSSVASLTLAQAGAAITGTSNDEVFASAREGMDAYVVNLPNGTYDVTLHFSEVWVGVNGPGERVVDIFVEGVHALAALDTYAEVGTAAALSKLIPGVVVTDSQLKMVFVAQVGAAALSGMSVELVEEAAPGPESTPKQAGTVSPTPTSPPAPTPTPTPVPQPVLLINVGGEDYIDTAGNQWMADGPYDQAKGWGYIDDGDA